MRVWWVQGVAGGGGGGGGLRLLQGGECVFGCGDSKSQVVKARPNILVVRAFPADRYTTKSFHVIFHYMHIYIYMYMCVYTHTYIYMYMYIFVCVCGVSAHMFVVHVCVYIYIS